MKKELFKYEKYKNTQEVLSMQIMNINQDSFSGDGITSDKEIEQKVREYFSSSINIIDIGAQSTNPGCKKYLNI